jgi:signal transduction histidine kinase
MAAKNTQSKAAVNREIFGYLKTRIGRRFLAVLLVISLVPLGVMRWMAIRKSKAAIQEQTFAILRAASDGAEGQVREFLHGLRENLLQIAQDESIQEQVRFALSDSPPAGAARALAHLLYSRRPEDVRDLLVLTPAGRVVASSDNQDLTTNSLPHEFFTRAAEPPSAGGIFMDPNTGKPTWIMSRPIRDAASHELLAFAAFRINPATLSALTSGRRSLSQGADTQSMRIGDTGETYIVNADGFMITESRYIPNAVLKIKVNTLPVRVGLERGQEITAQYKDYRDAWVSGSSVLLRDPNWILITEIDFTQAFAPIARFQNELVVAALVLIFLSILFAWSFTWRVVKPLRLLNQSDHALAEQDEAGALVSELGLPDDEIGELLRQRNARIKAVFDYQRLLEDRTAKLQEMVTEIEHISYAIVHDMRAPLRSMQGFATLLESDSAEMSPEEKKIYLRRISASAVRLDHLIRDVLTYNRTVLRHAALHPVDLQTLLRGIIESYPSLKPGSAEITIQGPMPVVIGNEALLTQCFSNILDNSVKFVAPGTTPRVRVWSESSSHLADGSIPAERAMVPPPPPISGPFDPQPKSPPAAGFVRIWIEDNGIGIPKSAQPRLFRMFQRLSDDDRGTGVGLAIVHKVVEQMGGSVGVQSSPGEGARFWVDLRQSLRHQEEISVAK